MSENYYDILSVNKNASPQELKEAFRKKALQCHPDRNPNDPSASEKFQKINEAYEVLKDKNQREQYDRLGHNMFVQSQQGGGGAGGFSGAYSGGFENVEDIFKTMFGGFGFGDFGSSRQRRTFVGDNRKVKITITLEDAFKGVEKSITYTKNAICKGCDGTGSKSKSNADSVCPTCKGKGVSHQGHGNIFVETTCHKCRGTGMYVSDPCLDCKGQGVSPQKRTIQINIPAGVNDESHYSVRSAGDDAPHNGQPGDLLVFIHIEPHKIFKRSDNDLICIFPISVFDAILGTEVDLPTIDGGRVKVKIKEGTQYDQKLRIKDKGMPLLGASVRRGDLYVHIRPEIPVNLKEDQKEALKKIRDDVKQSESHPQSEGFLKVIKNFWDNLTH